jgi:HK97 gp10 family phage protein
MKLEDFVRAKVDDVKKRKALQAEKIMDAIYDEARDLARSSAGGLRNAESGLTERTGKFFKSISKRSIIEPDGSLSFEVYYDKNICSYADYLEHGTRRIKPFKILTRAYENILGEK